MTLTITVPGPRAIYQSADYRLLDLSTGRTADFTAQKAVVINAFGWTAIVAFAGIGRTATVDVSEWLAHHVASIGGNDPFSRVIEALLEADSWLSPVEVAHRQHSFSVGAFQGSTPTFALVSNHESTIAPPARVAAARLSVTTMHPRRATTFVSGQAWAISRPERRRLARLVQHDPEAPMVYEALAEVTRAVADVTPLVSPSCFTSHVRLTGEGGGQIHGGEGIPFVPTFAFPPGVRSAVTRLLDEQFGPGRARIVSMSSARSEATAAFHKTQIREKPLDANVHNNFGAYLKEREADLTGAEREYRRALELDPNHVSALGNLANLSWEMGHFVEARELYERALQLGPRAENVSWNFARFLLRENERAQAQAVAEQALEAHPDSARLRLLLADMFLLEGRGRDALEEYDRASQAGAGLASVEAGRATALHLSGAPLTETIGAYWTAVGLDRENPALRLNLAQLLFLKGDDKAAQEQLSEAVKRGLENSAKLEAEFYLVAHTSVDLSAVVARVRGLVDAGARLRWDVTANIELVERNYPERGQFLRQLRGFMSGDLPAEALPIR